jgi:hypothetical protein
MFILTHNISKETNWDADSFLAAQYIICHLRNE